VLERLFRMRNNEAGPDLNICLGASIASRRKRSCAAQRVLVALGLSRIARVWPCHIGLTLHENAGNRLECVTWSLWNITRLAVT